ncbi:MAG: glutathione S-transferase [Acetobacteraceae bacterium]
MLRILGKATSINVRKVLWTCAEIGRPFIREDWGNGFADTSAPTFLALNPNGLVPVLVDGETVLWESNTICRYLAAVAERSDLLPTSPAARARVEQWMDWQATDLNSAWRGAFMGLVRRDPAYADPQRIAASEQPSLPQPPLSVTCPARRDEDRSRQAQTSRLSSPRRRRGREPFLAGA